MPPLLVFCICKQHSLNRLNRISIASTHRWVKSIHQKRIYKKLTAHETMVIELLMKSFTPYSISKKLNISIKTVSAHKINALTKLRARNFFCFLKEYNIWLLLWNTYLHKSQSF
ncbi:LuxR C-terminal-related transcriptional regulator [Citrobacter freundii]|uniref:LuxR C-terminal-related transcriptional regulator n=1 Tax=Citrobacter freundii TaxID=546 RepID=UPI003877FA7A